MISIPCLPQKVKAKAAKILHKKTGCFLVPFFFSEHPDAQTPTASGFALFGRHGKDEKSKKSPVNRPQFP